MDNEELYRKIALRKQNAEHLKPYNGGNGRIDKFLDMVRSGHLKQGGKILDVGGSHGDLVELALREGLFQTGEIIDISQSSVNIALERGLTAWRLDVDKDGLDYTIQDSTDCVVALDFIEHIVDPGQFARECMRVLNPGGFVFINTPNISYWEHLEELVVRGRFPHTSGDQEVYHGGHLAFYNENDLDTIFGAAGFTDFKVHEDPAATVPSSPLWERLLTAPGHKKARMLSSPNLLFSCRKP